MSWWESMIYEIQLAFSTSKNGILNERNGMGRLLCISRTGEREKTKEIKFHETCEHACNICYWKKLDPTFVVNIVQK